MKQNSISTDLLCTHRNLFDIWEDNNLLIENKHVFIKKASLLYVFLHFCKIFFNIACGNSKAGIKKSLKASSSSSSKYSITVYVKRTPIYEVGNNFFSISITFNNTNTTCYCCCIPYIQTFLQMGFWVIRPPAPQKVSTSSTSPYPKSSHYDHVHSTFNGLWVI